MIGLVEVVFLKDHQGHVKGKRLRVDPVSAESLIKARVVKRADPVPVPEEAAPVAVAETGTEEDPELTPLE